MFISFAIVHVLSISIGPPFLKSCVTPLHSNVFAGQSLILPTIKPIKIYTFRILYTHYAWVLQLWTKDIDLKGGSRGGARGARAPYFWTNGGPRGRKTFFFNRHPPLISGSGHKSSHEKLPTYKQNIFISETSSFTKFNISEMLMVRYTCTFIFKHVPLIAQR